jgi:hypothetical protein
VALGRLDDGTFQSFPVDISSDSGPSYILGRSPPTDMDTMAWFQDPELNVFCFPNESIGPDVAAILMLADGRRLPILLQIENFMQKSLGQAVTADGLRTNDPKQFISRCSSDKEPSQQPSATKAPPQVKKNMLYTLTLCFIPFLTL